MPCYSPLKGFRSRVANKSGKYSIVFNANDGYADIKVEVPCGQCVGCKLERSRQWAVRCMHEASLHEDNCFITLTYDDENLPEHGSLVKKDFQDFMKRLRKEYSDKKIRYFHCGEYGDLLARPHYHAVLFGIDFPDREYYDSGKNMLSSSPTLSKLWTKGFNTVGDCTFESCAYVARYVLKKVNGSSSWEHYSDFSKDSGEVYRERIPEYVTMSRGRRPDGGIGYGWFQKFKDEVFPQDRVVVNGKERKPPKYYDFLYESIDKNLLDLIKSKRMNLPKEVLDDNTPERLLEKEELANLLLKNNYKRGYENE